MSPSSLFWITHAGLRSSHSGLAYIRVACSLGGRDGRGGHHHRSCASKHGDRVKHQAVESGWWQTFEGATGILEDHRRDDGLRQRWRTNRTDNARQAGDPRPSSIDEAR